MAVVEREEARGTLVEALDVKAYAGAAGWVYETAGGSNSRRHQRFTVS